MRPGHRACVGAASIGRLPTVGARAHGALGPRLRGVARTGGRRTRCGFVAGLRGGRSRVVGRVGPLLRVGTGAGRTAIGRRAACLLTALTGRLRGARTGRQVDGRGRPLGTGDEGTRLRGSSVVAPLGMPSAVLIRPGGRVAVGDCARGCARGQRRSGRPREGPRSRHRHARSPRRTRRDQRPGRRARGRRSGRCDQRRACRARHQRRRMRPPPRRVLESRPDRGRAPSHGRSQREPGRGRAHRCRRRIRPACDGTLVSTGDGAALRATTIGAATLRTIATGTARVRRAALGAATVGPETAGLAAIRFACGGTLGTTGGLAVLGPAAVRPTAVGRPAVGGAALGRRAAGSAAIGTGGVGHTAIERAAVRPAAVGSTAVRPARRCGQTAADRRVPAVGAAAVGRRCGRNAR